MLANIFLVSPLFLSWFSCLIYLLLLGVVIAFSGLVGYELVVAKSIERGFVVLLGRQSSSAGGLVAFVKVRVYHVFCLLRL